MAESNSAKPSFSSGRRSLLVLNTILTIGAALALYAMINYLAAGYFKRVQWSGSGALKLSRQTLRILDSLTNDVAVTIFFEANGRNPDVYEMSRALLGEYQNACPRHVHVKTLDYTRFAGEAKELLARYRLSGLKEKDFVLFESGGHSKIVYAGELADYDFSDVLAGGKYVRRNAFRGEMLFTADIYAVSYPQPMKTYFLYGHGENNPGNPDGSPEKLGPSGYSKMAAILKDEINSEWDILSLGGTNLIPADCQLLIVAGPGRGRFLPEEIGKIAAYLKQGGRLLALLNQDCGLEPLLADWGISLGDSRVVDASKEYNIDGYTFFTAKLVPHPIVDPLASQKIAIRMVWPRPLYPTLQQAKIPGAPEVNFLAWTSDQGINERKQVASYALLAAIQQGVITGVNSPRGGGTRILVAGDSDFLDDQVIDSVYGNHYFAGLALNWLLERPQIVLEGLAPQPIHDYKLYMTHSQRKAAQLLFLAGMPGAVLLLGFLVWLRRRN